MKPKDYLFKEIVPVPEPEEVQVIRDKIKELQIKLEYCAMEERVEISNAITRLMDKLHKHGYKF